MKGVYSHCSRSTGQLLLLFVLSSSMILSQDRNHVLIQRDMKTGKDSIVTSLETREVPYDTVRVRRQWSKVVKGSTEAEIRKLLGTPSKIQEDPENAIIYWWYGKQAVAFNSISRKVTFWDK